MEGAQQLWLFPFIEMTLVFVCVFSQTVKVTLAD